jgi:hypothetical protein
MCQDDLSDQFEEVTAEHAASMAEVAAKEQEIAA